MRRDAGEGSVYQRADGKWEAAISLPPVDGKRRRRKAVAHSKPEALRRLRELQRSGGLNTAAWLLRWIEEDVPQRVRPRTLEGYRSIVVRHLVPQLGAIPLRELSAADIRSYMHRKAVTLSPRTIQYHHAVLRRALRVAEGLELVDRNVAMIESARPARVVRKRLEPLTLEQTRGFLQVIGGDSLEALWVLAATTGMRRSEILGLTWPTVDLEAGTLRVERTLQRYGGGYHLDAPKTRSSRRAIPLAPPVVEALRRHHEHRPAARRWDLVFTDEAGEPFDGEWVTRRFRQLLERAGLPRVRFHDLRHGAATAMLAAGVSIAVVKELLGHSTIGSTVDTYGHLDSVPKPGREAAEALAQGLLAAA